jgi:hypothetical protein
MSPLHVTAVRDTHRSEPREHRSRARTAGAAIAPRAAMTNLSRALVLAFVAACGGSDGADKFISDYGAIKDRLCACTDKDCTTKLKAEADAHEARGRTEIPKPTKEQKDRFKAFEREVNDCARKF